MVFLVSERTHYAVTGQKNEVALIKAMLIKETVTLFLFLNTQVFVWAQRLNTLWYPGVQDNYSAERLAADSQAGTSESLQ